jgi:hypothetical protein
VCVLVLALGSAVLSASGLLQQRQWQWHALVADALCLMYVSWVSCILLLSACLSCTACTLTYALSLKPHRKRPKADAGGSEWDTGVEATPAAGNRWDATPGGALGGATPGPNSWDATPGAALGGSKWDATPGAGLTGATPAPRRNRWDETPAAVSVTVVAVLRGTRETPAEREGSGSSSVHHALYGLHGLCLDAFRQGTSGSCCS